MATSPNIIVIMTDQQRHDTIGALGHAHMTTPHLDRLVREGTAFAQTYCTAPSCAPSRASFFNMRYPHMQGVFKNQQAWGSSWAEQLQSAGYHTVSIGKMHTIPFDEKCGFDQRFVVENKDRKMELTHPHGPFYDEWDKFLAGHGASKPSRMTYREDNADFEEALGAFAWPLEERFHPDVFVGQTAKWYIEQRQSPSPFFLHIGFPGPHPPYDPPQRFLEQYADTVFPLPEVREEELAGQPPVHDSLREEMRTQCLDAVTWPQQRTAEQLTRLRRHYAANVTLIDEQIGEILAALEAKGLLDDSIVIFTSDHGDCLGNHGHIQKWTMYDEVTRVPMLVRAPGRLPQGKRSEALIQHMDVAATLMELLGMPVPRDCDAISLSADPDAGREYVFAEHARDLRLKDIHYMTMVRDKSWKLVHYLDQPWGELYDLRTDPGELRNLWHDEAYSKKRGELLDVIRDWRIRNTCRRVPEFGGFYD